jgi:hypothetical protein
MAYFPVSLLHKKKIRSRPIGLPLARRFRSREYEGGLRYIPALKLDGLPWLLQTGVRQSRFSDFVAGDVVVDADMVPKIQSMIVENTRYASALR